MSLSKSLIGQIGERRDENQICLHMQHGCEMTEIQTLGSNTILSVQRNIEETWGIPIPQQRLHLNIFINKNTSTINTGYLLTRYNDVQLVAPSHFRPSSEMQRKLMEILKEVQTCSEKDVREEEAKLMNEMVLETKAKNFVRYFEILIEKKHLLNGIPERRRWSALHQAVYSKSVPIVKRFLSFEHCDVHVKASERNQITKHGETPAELAKMFNLDEIRNLLLARSGNIMRDVPAFVELVLANENGQWDLPLFYTATAFLPKDILHKLDSLGCLSLLSLTESLFDMTGNHFESLKSSVVDTLYPYSQDLCQMLHVASNPDEFELCLVKIFSIDHVYANVNEALRRSAENVDPTGNDLRLCLYAFVLQATLLHSTELGKYQYTTYRGCDLNSDQMAMYQVGKEIVWVSMTSSSKSASDAFRGNVRFVIENQLVSHWSPRVVDHLARVNADLELIHPAGSKFQVVQRHAEKDFLEIKLKRVN